jgi:hypothetical protein
MVGNWLWDGYCFESHKWGVSAPFFGPEACFQRSLGTLRRQMGQPFAVQVEVHQRKGGA